MWFRHALVVVFFLWQPAISRASILIQGGPVIPSTDGTDVPAEPPIVTNSAGVVVGNYLVMPARGETYSRAVRFSATNGMFLPDAGTSSSGKRQSSVSSLNETGFSAGSSDVYDGNGIYLGQRAMRWDPSGNPLILQGVAGGSAQASAINASNVVVGSVYRGAPGYRAARWDAGSATPTELGVIGHPVNQDVNARVSAINDSGVIVGYMTRYEGSSNLGTRPVRWDAGSTGATELAFSNPSDQGYARAINASGVIIGYRGTGEFGVGRAVRWLPSSTTAELLADIGLSNGGTAESAPVAINAAGTIAGTALKFDSTHQAKGNRAVRWSAAGSVTELGILSATADGISQAYATSINDADEVVGYAFLSGTADQDPHATYWGPDGVALDLNTLLAPNSGWKLYAAYSISNTGWIAGSGLFDPDGPGGGAAYERLFVMQVPEPSVALVSLLGMALLRKRTSRA